MKLLGWFVAILAALVVVIVAVSFFLPSKVLVQRSIVIAAEPEQIFPYFNSLKTFHQWSPWSEKDPNAVYEFSGPDSGVGSRMSWTSESRTVGSGAQEIVESVENERVRTRLEFKGYEPSFAELTVSPIDGGSEVVWSYESEITGFPVGRYVGLMMDGWIGGEYENGLERLKSLVENP